MNHFRAQPDTVGKYLPHLRGELLSAGVHSVLASYGGKIGETKMLMVFLDSGERPMSPTIGGRASVEIGRLFTALICRRCPEVPGECGSGTLEWNLLEDTLDHHHQSVKNIIYDGLI